MPRTPSQSIIAGAPRRAPARGRDAGQGRNPADRVRELSDKTDELQRLQSGQSRGTDDYEREVDLVEEIAAGWCELKAHYRGPSSAPCRAPLFVSADGKKAGW